jgi:hypothetical protein
VKKQKKTEEYFYTEVKKFREKTKIIFVKLMTALLKMRSAPLSSGISARKGIGLGVN